jgi:hypothetical protein
MIRILLLILISGIFAEEPPPPPPDATWLEKQEYKRKIREERSRIRKQARKSHNIMMGLGFIIQGTILESDTEPEVDISSPMAGRHLRRHPDGKRLRLRLESRIQPGRGARRPGALHPAVHVPWR